MKSSKTDRIYAAIGTVALHALLLIILLVCCLKFPPDGMEWPPSTGSEIVLEEVEDLYASGEYVRIGDDIDLPLDAEPMPSAETSPEPTQTNDDATNSGVAAPSEKPVLTSQQPSEAKAETKPTGPTQEEIAAQQEAKRQQEARQNAANATQRAFGGGRSTGTAGSSTGNATSTGAVEGMAGSGVRGRSLESWRKVASTKLGVISIRVKVDAQGRVTSATYDAAGSSGAVAADLTMRNRCVAESRSCRFSVLEGSASQSGTIIWTFK